MPRFVIVRFLFHLSQITNFGDLKRSLGQPQWRNGKRPTRVRFAVGCSGREVRLETVSFDFCRRGWWMPIEHGSAAGCACACRVIGRTRLASARWTARVEFADVAGEVQRGQGRLHRRRHHRFGYGRSLHAPETLHVCGGERSAADRRQSCGAALRSALTFAVSTAREPWQSRRRFDRSRPGDAKSDWLDPRIRAR